MLKPTRFELAILLVMAGLIAYQLFTPPPFGPADNGDFQRFLGKSGLKQIPTEYTDNYWYYFNSKYLIVPASRFGEGYKSSTELFVRAARWANVQFISREVFDVRVLGALYAAIYLIGVYLLLVASRPLSRRTRMSFAGLMLLILTDAGYIAYFNSFYSEPTGLVFFLIVTGCALLLITRSGGLLVLAGYFASCAVFVTAKPMYVPLAIVLALFGLYLSSFISSKLRYLLSLTLAGILCAVGLWYHYQTPEQLSLTANYLGLSYLLKYSPNPERDLIELGLNPEWSSLAGSNPYAPDSRLLDSSFRSEFTARVSSLTLPMFYLKRPSRLFDLASRTARQTLRTRLIMGYYEKQSGQPPRAQPPGLWSDMRDLVFPKSVWFLMVFFSVSIAATIVGSIRAPTETHRGLFIFYGLLLCIALAEFFVPILILGEIDLVRYLLLFNFSFDACLVLIVVALPSLNSIGLFRHLASHIYRIRGIGTHTVPFI